MKPPAMARLRMLLRAEAFDAVVIGAFVGLSLLLAQMLALQRPYWVPVSCLA